MRLLTIRHTTRYSYKKPVRFGPHRMMFRPRDSHDIRVISSGLIIKPQPELRWFHDVFGNSVAIATFEEPAEELFVDSMIMVEHYGSSEFEFPLDPAARTLPISYSSEEYPDLARTIERQYHDSEKKIDAWARKFRNETGPTDIWILLEQITKQIRNEFQYIPREDEGVQAPLETLARQTGTCRDYALFMMEALRSLGMAARFVTGYLYDPALEGGDNGTVGAGATHAWVQVYLPGPGWVECDPTNGIIGGSNLIRVGVARDPAQALPFSGSYFGDRDDFIEMEAEVTVTTSGAPAPMASASDR
ncbi:MULTISPECIES: transglutaminase family protein [Limibacillus]|jgi:transglutaminase-like putative cysteine protease|uniref:Transglutaminase-like putative cysteine protease n=1 Tax=Limibacillus halophilus TaxID=1579333 RepID=A0A839SQX0_9PROT|nr:transglutaminase family protein [Limibacillus halophilus]MBB3065287.1 transglutaminase-like putative cysteine protease [Limibacillus halophilus]